MATLPSRKNASAKLGPKEAVTANGPAEDAQRLPPRGKLGVLVQLLSRTEGVTIAQMAEATGWQDHSVRGAMAGALRKRGYATSSAKTGKVRMYRLAHE